MLLLGALFALLIGEQAQFFGTDIGPAQFLQHPARHAIRPRCPGQDGGFLEWLADRASFEVAEQASDGTPAVQTRLTPEAPSRHFHPPKERGDAPAHRAFQSVLLAAVRTPAVLVFPLPDRLFQGRSHRLLPAFVYLLFHLAYACTCCYLDRERYLNLHEWTPSVSFIVRVSLLFANPGFWSEPSK